MGLFLRGLLLSIAIPMLQRSHLVIYIIDEMETESIKFNSQYQQTETETETENHNNNVKRRSRKISGIASDQVMVHYEFEKVEIEIRANMLEDQWLAVGFSDYGEVTNADACIYWTDQTGKTHFQDVYTDSDSFVATDEENNCILLNSRITKRHLGTKELHILYSRKFDTCDENDYIIEVVVTHFTASLPWSRSDR
ncbi:Dopamine beta-hydroxylase [Nymphon striatum]|nr:Dopamine beta-hydroxylase [Nymphon striatum]